MYFTRIVRKTKKRTSKSSFIVSLPKKLQGKIGSQNSEISTRFENFARFHYFYDDIEESRCFLLSLWSNELPSYNKKTNTTTIQKSGRTSRYVIIPKKVCYKYEWTAGTKLDDKWTNAYATPGCTVLYDQSVVSTNDIFGEVRQSSGSGCTSITETYTFDDPNGSYGSTITPIQLELEYYDTTCSDFSGMGNVDFTNGLVDISGVSSTPTYSASYSGSCFSSTAGSGYVTVS